MNDEAKTDFTFNNISPSHTNNAKYVIMNGCIYVYESASIPEDKKLKQFCFYLNNGEVVVFPIIYLADECLLNVGNIDSRSHRFRKQMFRKTKTDLASSLRRFTDFTPFPAAYRRLQTLKPKFALIINAIITPKGGLYDTYRCQ